MFNLDKIKMLIMNINDFEVIESLQIKPPKWNKIPQEFFSSPSFVFSWNPVQSHVVQFKSIKKINYLQHSVWPIVHYSTSVNDT